MSWMQYAKTYKGFYTKDDHDLCKLAPPIPKGKYHLTRNRSHNEHPTSSFWHLVPCFPRPWFLQSVLPGTLIPPRSCFPLPGYWGQPPRAPEVLKVTESQACRPPSSRYCYAWPPNSHTFFPRLSGLRCPAHSSLPTGARSEALKPGPHCLVRFQIVGLSRFHAPTRSGVGCFCAPRFQSTPPPTDAENGF